MWRGYFIVIFLTIAYFVYSEMKRKRGIIKAEDELRDSKFYEKELELRKDVGHQSRANETIEDDIDAIYEPTNEAGEPTSKQNQGEVK